MLCTPSMIFQVFTLSGSVLEIDTDLNLINSTVQAEEPTGNISPISNYDGSYVHTNVASV